MINEAKYFEINWAYLLKAHKSPFKRINEEKPFVSSPLHSTLHSFFLGMLSQIQSTVPPASLHLRSLSFIHGGCSLCSLSFTFRNGRCTTRARAISRRAEKKRDDEAKEKGGGKEGLVEILERVAESSGMGARERRLLKVREAKRQREYERNHAYPQWAKSVFLLSFYSFFLDNYCM